MRAWLSGPWGAACLIGLAAQLLFSIGLTTPHRLMFDETHYVPAARALLALSRPVNIEHPLVGKELIALGMLLFGDNSLGWRAFASLAGTATLLGLFAILHLLTGRTRVAVIGSVLALLNFALFIQARIAMLDIFATAFLLPAIALFLWSMKAPPERVLRRWLLAAALLGLAIGAKWAAAPFLGYAVLVIVLVRWRDAGRAGRPPAALFEIADGPLWLGLPAASALPWLLAVSVGVYLATFLPAFFYAEQPLNLASLLAFQGRMYAEQTQVLAPHPNQSSWWTWPFDIRSIWYLYEVSDGGVWRGVLMIGNPVIWWGGVCCVAAALWKWAMGGPARALLPTALWAAALLPYALIPKSLGFLYYYFPASLFLCGVIATELAPRYGRDRRFWYFDTLFAVIAAVAFLYFYPILSAAALPDSQAFRQWMWLPTWP